MVIYSLSQILSEAGGPGNERLRAGAKDRAEDKRQSTFAKATVDKERQKIKDIGKKLRNEVTNRAPALRE